MENPFVFGAELEPGLVVDREDGSPQPLPCFPNQGKKLT
jgi:hypothetical protein